MLVERTSFHARATLFGKLVRVTAQFFWVAAARQLKKITQVPTCSCRTLEMQAVQSRSQGTAQGGGSAARSALSQAQQRALIPQSTLDYPTQRLYASAIFGVLQALKAYETYRAYTATYPEQYNGAAAKWWLFDLAYLIALWILQIPWLQFSFLKTILLAFLMGIVDLLLFAIPVVSLWKFLVKGSCSAY